MKKRETQEIKRIDTEGFKMLKKFPVVIILDNVRSMHNVGSIFRTCDAFAVEKICLCGITPQPPHREIEKTALGATKSVEWVSFDQTIYAVDAMKSEGYEIWAIEQLDESIDLGSFQPSANHKYALVFGNEVYGVSDDILPSCNGGIEIPQFGTKHSFNVVISAGIVLWDFYSKSLPAS